jgi:nicotinamide-nucleotide amidase
VSSLATRLAEALVTEAGAKQLKLSCAESCTGGLAAAALTSVSGASAVFDQGFVTYANAAKHRALGVPLDLLASKGAVSGEVAAAMARGARDRAAADIAVSITGIAGPGGGSPQKPVGLVWFGLAESRGVRTERRTFAGGSREFVRGQARVQALRMLLEAVRRA